MIGQPVLGDGRRECGEKVRGDGAGSCPWIISEGKYTINKCLISFTSI
ncbi:MAG: hypothetical protein ACTSUE_27125 [Promethearchaeota archaeon]